MSTDIQFWLTDQELKQIYSHDYWNCEEHEKQKAYYIVDGNAEKLISYLKYQSNEFAEYESVIKFAKKLGLRIEGTGADLAAGVCWSTALLSRIGTVQKLYAIEISKHRIIKIAPAVLDLLEASKDKIIRVLGSFYGINLPDESIDFCFMCHGFHHADNPGRLLSEIQRILKPNGFFLIIGEKPVSFGDFLKALIKNLIKIVVPLPGYYKKKPIRKLFPDFKELYPPDNELGDHYYRIRDYDRIFHQNGFCLYQNRESRFITFIAQKM